MNQAKQPQKKPTLPTLRSWTSRLQNYEKIDFCCFSPQVCGTCCGSPRRLTHQLIIPKFGKYRARIKHLTFLIYTYLRATKYLMSKSFSFWLRREEGIFNSLFCKALISGRSGSRQCHQQQLPPQKGTTQSRLLMRVSNAICI